MKIKMVAEERMWLLMGNFLVNQKEYEWIKQTRGILLDFCTHLDPNDFTRQMDGFGFQSIRQTLVHVADCYIAWLGSFVLLKTKSPITSKEKLQQMGLEEIKERFEQADLYVNEVYKELEHDLDKPIQRKIPWREQGDMISLTLGKLLIHTITHEFHHKGQIAAMIRQLGYEPPNTDVLGTDD